MNTKRCKAKFEKCLHIFSISFHFPNRYAAAPLTGSMLWRISTRGESVDSDTSVCHISKPSILLRSWISPPAAEYSVGSQSVTCIRSMLTRPLVESRGLWTNPAPRIPPVHGMEKENKPFRDISAKLTTFHRWEQITHPQLQKFWKPILWEPLSDTKSRGATVYTPIELTIGSIEKAPSRLCRPGRCSNRQSPIVLGLLKTGWHTDLYPKNWYFEFFEQEFPLKLHLKYKKVDIVRESH